MNMASARSIVFALLIAVFLSACPKSNTIVALPDNKGHRKARTNGEQELNEAQQVLSRPMQAVAVTQSESGFGQVKIMSKRDIEKTFGTAINAQPLPSSKFILYFEFGSDELNAVAEQDIQKILLSIQKRNSKDISINGHTDKAGAVDFNQALAEKRAKRVRDILVQKGIPPEYLRTCSHGEGNPLITTRDNQAEPKNRRVEVIVR